MTDMKTQLSNVAFGGSWSEEILDRSKLNNALEVIARAVEDCTEYDMRTPALFEALAYIKDHIGKGSELTDGFLQALAQPNPSLRYAEAKHCEANIIRWSGMA
jgi:hypothetical protein